MCALSVARYQNVTPFGAVNLLNQKTVIIYNLLLCLCDVSCVCALTTNYDAGFWRV